jgi:flagellar protein FlbD
MIHLTRLNNTKLVINSDLIKFVEQSPDTVITLLSGEKILVQETVDEIVERVVDFRRQLLSAVVNWTGARAAQFPVSCTPAQLQKESEG